MTDEQIEAIAKVCHAANAEYCRIIGDETQVPWGHAPEWQKESIIKGVQFILSNPSAAPDAAHASWLAEKEADGWVWGAVKDADAKTHPCIKPFDELPPEQQMKDRLFIGIVLALFVEIRLSAVLALFVESLDTIQETSE